ncbi:MAG: hypothetical protein AAGF59_07015 [Pseudomonadota bacterium]
MTLYRTRRPDIMIGALRSLVAAFFLLTPLIGLLIAGFADAAPGLPYPTESVFDPRIVSLFLRSVVLTAAVSASIMAISILAARRIWFSLDAKYRFLTLLPIASIAVPPYLHALAWQDFGQAVNDWMVTATGFGIHTPAEMAAFWCLTAAFLPIGFAFALFGYAHADRDQIVAGRLFGTEAQVFRQIELPMIAPFALAGGLFVALMTLADHGVPSAFGIRSYALEIFAVQNQTANPLATLILAAPIVLLSLGLVILLALRMSRLAIIPNLIPDPGPRPVTRHLPLRIAENSSVLLLSSSILVLFVTSLIRPILTGSFSKVLPGVWESVAATGTVAATAGVFALIAGLSVPATAKRPLLLIAACIPLAIPPVALGGGLIVFWNRAAFDPVFDSLLLPALGCAARFAPIAVLIVGIYRSTIAVELIDAARLYRSGPLADWLRIRLPLASGGLVAAILVVAAFSASELPLTLLTIPPGDQTLVVRAFTLLHYGARDQVDGLSALLILITTLPILFAVTLLRFIHPARRKAHS